MGLATRRGHEAPCHNPEVDRLNYNRNEARKTGQRGNITHSMFGPTHLLFCLTYE